MVNLGAAEDARGSPPPATRTRPSERHVIEKSCRAVTMLPVVDHVFVDGSKSSALATVPKLAFPAATSTFPLASVHAPKLRRGVLMLPTAVHVRPERIVNLSGCGRDVVTRVTACHQDRAIFQQRSDMVLSSHVHRERARAPGGRQQYPGVDGGTLHALRNARFEEPSRPDARIRGLAPARGTVATTRTTWVTGHQRHKHSSAPPHRFVHGISPLDCIAMSAWRDQESLSRMRRVAPTQSEAHARADPEGQRRRIVGSPRAAAGPRTAARVSPRQSPRQSGDGSASLSLRTTTPESTFR